MVTTEPIKGTRKKYNDKALNSDEISDNFGSDSDFIREVLEIALQTKSDEDHIRLLSAMKLSIKKVAK